MREEFKIILLFVLVLILIHSSYAQECLGTRDSCCTSYDCYDYCSDNITRKYAGSCVVRGSACVYATEVCEYGCENGVCKQPCTMGYTDSYRCFGGWLQREYRHSDCSLSWRNYQYCDYGCENNTCKQLCTPGYLDEYKCEGNSRYRKYQYSYCNTTWIFLEDCKYGCSEGICLPKPQPEEKLGESPLLTAGKLVFTIAIVFLFYQIIKLSKAKKKLFLFKK